jgi:hypothetical protein
MQDNFLVLRTNKVIDDVRGGGITTGVAEPLGTDKTLYNGSRVVYSAIAIIRRSEKTPRAVRRVYRPACMWWEVNLALFLEIIQNGIKILRDTPICGL